MNPIGRISRMSSRGGRAKGLTNLVETDVGGLLTEALTADVQAILADETGLVGADTAVYMSVLHSLS